jgi:hypothetical protein
MTPVPAIDRAFAAVSGPLAAAGVECLLIGGFAVNHYGYTRNTLDVDFMIAADRLDETRRVMVGLGFSNVAIEDNVAFFSMPGSAMRVDFLRVDAATLRELIGRSAEAVIHGHRLRVPALLDLVSMKIFSLAQSGERRAGKDLPDIVHLGRIHGLDLHRDIRPICARFGNEAVFDRIAARWGEVGRP